MAASPTCAQDWHSGPRRRSASAEVGQCSETKTSSAPPPAVRPAMVGAAGPVPRTVSSGAWPPPRPPSLRLPLPSVIRAGSTVRVNRGRCARDSRPLSNAFVVVVTTPTFFCGRCHNAHNQVQLATGRGSARGHPPCHAEQVLLAVQRVVVGPRPVRYVSADRLVVAE